MLDRSHALHEDLARKHGPIKLQIVSLQSLLFGAKSRNAKFCVAVRGQLAACCVFPAQPHSTPLRVDQVSRIREILPVKPEFHITLRGLISGLAGDILGYATCGVVDHPYLYRRNWVTNPYTL